MPFNSVVSAETARGQRGSTCECKLRISGLIDATRSQIVTRGPIRDRPLKLIDAAFLVLADIPDQPFDAKHPLVNDPRYR
jgi:hypothetical protein